MNNLCTKFIAIFIFCIINVPAFSQDNMVESLSPIRARNIWYGDVQSAIGLKKGEGVIRNHNFLYSEFRHGLNNDFSFGMKLSFMPLFDPFFIFFNDDASKLSEHYALPMSINMEYKSFSNSLINVAFGAELMGNSLSPYYRQVTVGETPRIYLKSTIGNYQNNITVKAGMNVSLVLLDDVPYTNNLSEVLWFGSIAGKYQLLNKFDLIGEFNVDTYDRYFFTIENENWNPTFYFSCRLAIRAYFKERWSLDVGVKDGNPDFLAMPYLTITMPLHFEEE